MSGDTPRHAAHGQRTEHELFRAGLEALLFLAEEPIGVTELAEVLERDEDEVVRELDALADEYARAGRGMEVRRAAGGWRMYSAPIARGVLERWALAGRTGRLTQAALETLAIIAYKQPIGRQAIGDIRGVNPDAAVRSLVARGFVVEVGRDDGPGHAVLYGTTNLFLERLGVRSLTDLPELTEYLPEAPAPDEPELHALREVRRRLSAAGAMGPTTPADARGAPAPGGDDATAADDATTDEDDDLLPPPTPRRSAGVEADMDDLTDRLDQAARSAVSRLRAAIAAGDHGVPPETAPDQPDANGPSDATEEEPDHG